MSEATLSLQDGRLLLGGVVHFDNAAAVLARGRQLLATATGTVLVDMAGLSAGNSLVVAILLQWARDAARDRRDLRIAHMPDKLGAIIRVSGLSEVLTVTFQEHS